MELLLRPHRAFVDTSEEEEGREEKEYTFVSRRAASTTSDSSTLPLPPAEKMLQTSSKLDAPSIASSESEFEQELPKVRRIETVEATDSSETSDAEFEVIQDPSDMEEGSDGGSDFGTMVEVKHEDAPPQPSHSGPDTALAVDADLGESDAEWQML